MLQMNCRKTSCYHWKEKGGQFQYQISQTDQKIIVNMVLTISKPLFLPEEYSALKNFFDLVVNKQAEQIVLKKKTT